MTAPMSNRLLRFAAIAHGLIIAAFVFIGVRNAVESLPHSILSLVQRQVFDVGGCEDENFGLNCMDGTGEIVTEHNEYFIIIALASLISWPILRMPIRTFYGIDTGPPPARRDDSNSGDPALIL